MKKNIGMKIIFKMPVQVCTPHTNGKSVTIFNEINKQNQTSQLFCSSWLESFARGQQLVFIRIV